MTIEPPIVLEVGRASASIYPAHGGRLGQLDLGGGPLLRGPAPDLGWAAWGCYPLLPWSNRIPGGLLRFGGSDARLSVNWPDGSAIHGLVASSPWTVLSRSEQAAALEVRASGGPYRVHGAQSFELEEDGLRIRLAATNEGDRPVPVGIGIHPWFRHGRIRVAADERWPGEPLPDGPPEPVAGRDDLRELGVAEPMDACFTSLTEPVAEVPGLELHWEGPVTNIVVFTREPGWVCVEPVTMANNAFADLETNDGSGGVQVLDPGASIEVRYHFRRAPTAPVG